jgi:hypothetical protein
MLKAHTSAIKGIDTCEDYLVSFDQNFLKGNIILPNTLFLFTDEPVWDINQMLLTQQFNAIPKDLEEEGPWTFSSFDMNRTEIFASSGHSISV